MAKYELVAEIGGEEVVLKLDTNINLMRFKRFQEDGLISKNFLQNLMIADKDPEKANFDEMFNAPYMAYVNANPGNPMSMEEFNQYVPMDMEMIGEIYAEIISGQAKEGSAAGAFRKVTKKK